MVNKLPEGLAPPLPLLEEGGGIWAWLLLLLLALAWAWWRRRRRQPSDHPADPSVATVPEPAPRPLEDAIDILRERVLVDGDYRRGCHELAGLLRPRFRGALTRTARELRGFVDEPRVADLLARLEQLQFRRQPPDRPLFESVCRRAKAVVELSEAGEE